MSSTWEQARLIARTELRDGLRNRRQLGLRAATPLVLLVLLSGLFALGGSPRSVAPDTYTVALEGDARRWADVLVADGNPLATEPTDDAAVAVLGAAHTGMRTRGDRIVLVVDTTDKVSRAGAAAVRTALAAHGAPLPTTLTLQVDDRSEDDGEGGDARSALAQAAAGLVLLQGGVTVGFAATRVASERARRTLRPQLTQPLSRRGLLLGRVASEAVLGLTAGAGLLALGALLVGAVTLAEEGPVPALLVVATLALAAVAITTPCVTVGLALGLRARSPQQLSALTALSLVALAVLTRLVDVEETPQRLLSTLPLVGPARAVFEATTGRVDVAALAVSLVASAVVVAVLVDRTDLRREHLVVGS